MDVAARKARSTRLIVKDESKDGPYEDLPVLAIEYSEKHLHKGHNYELVETLHDNPVEFTTWAYCPVCETDFWYVSVELAAEIF
jgi:hypothetical protein